MRLNEQKKATIIRREVASYFGRKGLELLEKPLKYFFNSIFLSEIKFKGNINALPS
jgi:hypothetical protein